MFIHLLPAQLCIAINNIEQVRRYLSSLPEQLDYDRVMDGVLMEHGSVGEEQCRQTIHTMLSSADEDMLNVMGEIQTKADHDMQGVQGLETFHAKNPSEVDSKYYVTCSDRRRSLEGPGTAYQAINLRSPDVQLCSWKLVQKIARYLVERECCVGLPLAR